MFHVINYLIFHLKNKILNFNFHLLTRSESVNNNNYALSLKSVMQALSYICVS